MNLDKDKIIQKYEKYGFQYKKAYSNSSYLTFTFKSGFFHNAEIVKINKNENDESKIHEKIKSLQALDISVKIKEYDSTENIEQELFDGFFDVDSWRERIKSEYDEYITSVIKAYPKNGENLEYSYINAPYILVNEKLEENETIIENIAKRMNEKSAQLILIEAPAGFGKTCTSFELLKRFVEDKSKPIPFFTEFSRDRQAKIFSHVFIREVDRAFAQVSSSVVEDELKNGRITMVLDGFDELLSDNQRNEKSDDYENAEPMLETISELLCNNSKIIITSRKSAIFDGATFSEWIDRNIDNFKFLRYRIDPPRIEDWLDEDRRRSLTKANIDIKKLSNPVLLSYLRFINIEKFTELCSNSNEIVEQYFNSMLEREQERQNLLMPPNRQSDLLTELAADMCAKNYTSDSKEKIIDFFKNRCANILEETRKLYKPSEKPTLDALSNTLSNHAFFDRSNQGEGRIEFINEFVFGNYIGSDILRSPVEWISSDERFVDPAIISYIPRSTEEKQNLWLKLSPMADFLSTSARLKYEIDMLGELRENKYNQSSILSINLSDCEIFNHFPVSEITFTDCTFTNVIFDIKNITEITFINCKFYNCNFTELTKNTESFLFFNCIANDSFIEDIENHQTLENDEKTSDEVSDLTLKILEKFWRIGSSTLDRLHIPLASIFRISQSSTQYTKRDITLEIKKLKRDHILEDANNGEYIAVNRFKIPEIKMMLGR